MVTYLANDYCLVSSLVPERLQTQVAGFAPDLLLTYLLRLFVALSWPMATGSAPKSTSAPEYLHFHIAPPLQSSCRLSNDSGVVTDRRFRLSLGGVLAVASWSRLD